MTAKKSVGETSEGEGGTGTVTTEQIARAVARDIILSGAEVGHIHVQRLTEGIYSVEALQHGDREPERYFLSAEDVQAES